MRKPVVIYGNGELAAVAKTRLQASQEYRILGFTVDRICINSTLFQGLPLVPYEELGLNWPPEEVDILIAVGFQKGNLLRAARYESLKKQGYGFINLISPQALIEAEVKLGENCLIGPHAVIQAFSQVGNNVCLGTHSVIGHHSVIADHVYISAGVMLSGGVHIARYATLGTAVVVRERCQIGQGTLVGAGVVVLENLPDQRVYQAALPIELPISAADWFASS